MSQKKEPKKKPQASEAGDETPEAKKPPPIPAWVWRDLCGQGHQAF